MSFRLSPATGRINQSDILVVHQVVVVLQGVGFQAGEDTFRRAVLHRGVVHDPDGLGATAPSARMRAEDARVPRLDRHDALEEHRRSGVGDRRHGQDDSDGLGHFHQPAIRKLANDAHRTLVFDVVVDKLRGHHVLEELVFQHAQPGCCGGAVKRTKDQGKMADGDTRY